MMARIALAAVAVAGTLGLAVLVLYAQVRP